MEDRKKVLFLTNIPSPYRVDFFCEFAKYVDLTVLYELRAATDRDDNWKSNVEALNFKEMYLKPVIKQASSAFCPEVKKYLSKQDYDCIIVGGYSTPTGMYAIRYMKKKHIPYILNCDGGFPATAENRFKRRLKSYMISGAKAYLSPGRFADEYLVFYGADSSKIRRYHFSSIHESDIVEPGFIDSKVYDKERYTVISVGSFIKRKGFDILIEASKNFVKSVDLKIVGGEPTEEYITLKKQAEDVNQTLKIEFIPFKSKKEIFDLYKASDIFVLATREDIWGLVINEAMACGLPVITTDRCGAGIELLTPNDITPVEDALAVASRVNKYLNNLEYMSESGIRNVERIECNTIENMASEHSDIVKWFAGIFVR